MTTEDFDFLLGMIGALITKQSTKIRLAIPPRERHSSCGETFKSLSFQYRIGSSTISLIVMETCAALHHVMKDFLEVGSVTTTHHEFTHSGLYKSMDQGLLNCPPEPLTNSDIMMLYRFVGDEAYPLRPDLMKPYPYRQMGHSQRVLNYHVSRARRVVEKMHFGILANNFRVFRSTICLDVVITILLACIFLHAFV
ncbi:hypothetical protein N1851_024459 [Merluccius polli]|uniref:DDE Tnp4 domain-containing protein n=1 Tax=Merluccius polli TaxID=89951 RepID=A0AA47MF51_MERPO|nr:hypothetical protein N1851_024459 [Merluccius polli]